MKNFTMGFWLLVAATVAASIIYAAYPQVRLATVIAAIILVAILVVNRFIDPRWDLSDRQREFERRWRIPAAAALTAFVLIVTIGENGFRTVSGTLQVALLCVIVCLAAYYFFFPKKAKKKD